MSTKIGEFMDALAKCCDRENYLSDITYAMCQSNQIFRQFFVDFFFKDRHIDAQQVSITREYRFEDSRPDFLIETRDPKEIFIVEVKINDRNQHFKQYEDALKRLCNEVGIKINDDWKNRIGYITNYRIDTREVKEAKGFERGMYTWEELYKQLAEKAYGKDLLEDEMINGYRQILKAVCGFIDIGKFTINLGDFEAVKQSMKWFEQVVAVNDCNVVPYNGYYQQACMKYWRIGRFFEVKNYCRNQSVWGWIGVYLVEEGAECVIAFEDKRGWGDKVCKRFKCSYERRALENQTLEYSEHDKCLYFYMNGQFTPEGVQRFFNNTIRYIRGDENAFSVEDRNLANCNRWLSMIKLPAFIKSELFRGWATKGCEVSLSGSGMSAYDYARNAFSSCLEWFKLSFKQQGRRGYRRDVWGFVGVAWDGGQWIGDDSFKRSKGMPKFVVGIYDLEKKEVENAKCHGWIEQREKKTWLKFFREHDLTSVTRLRTKFQNVLKEIILVKKG